MSVQVLIGFDVSIVGAEIMVCEATALARRTGKSPMVLCITVFAVGLWQLYLNSNGRRPTRDWIIVTLMLIYDGHK